MKSFMNLKSEDKMQDSKDLLGKNQYIGKDLLASNPYIGMSNGKDIADINKRNFLKKAIFGVAAGIGILAFSKAARAAGGFIKFPDATTQTSASALTRVGGNTTEATSTSTSNVDLITATVSIDAGSQVYVRCAIRKTTGAAAAVNLGFKLNATGVVGLQASFSTTNQAENGFFETNFYYGVTNYLNAGNRLSNTSEAAGANETQLATRNFWEAAMPTATLTSVIVKGSTGDSLITMAADELHVYSFSTS